MVMWGMEGNRGLPGEIDRGMTVAGLAAHGSLVCAIKCTLTFYMQAGGHLFMQLCTCMHMHAWTSGNAHTHFLHHMLASGLKHTALFHTEAHLSAPTEPFPGRHSPLRNTLAVLFVNTCVCTHAHSCPFLHRGSQVHMNNLRQGQPQINFSAGCF